MANYGKSTLIGSVLNNQHKEALSRIEQDGPIARASAVSKILENLKKEGIDLSSVDVNELIKLILA